MLLQPLQARPSGEDKLPSNRLRRQQLVDDKSVSRGQTEFRGVPVNRLAFQFRLFLCSAALAALQYLEHRCCVVQPIAIVEPGTARGPQPVSTLQTLRAPEPLPYLAMLPHLP